MKNVFLILLTQINLNREEAPVLSKEISTVQHGMRYTNFVMQVSQSR